MGCGTRLAHAVTLLYWDLYSLVDSFDQLLRQRCGARTQHSEGTEIILVDRRMFAKEQDDRWHDVYIGNPVVLYHGADLFKIEFWQHRDCQSRVEALMYKREQAYAGYKAMQL